MWCRAQLPSAEGRRQQEKRGEEGPCSGEGRDAIFCLPATFPAGLASPCGITVSNQSLVRQCQVTEVFCI